MRQLLCLERSYHHNATNSLQVSLKLLQCRILIVSTCRKSLKRIDVWNGRLELLSERQLHRHRALNRSVGHYSSSCIDSRSSCRCGCSIDYTFEYRASIRWWSLMIGCSGGRWRAFVMSSSSVPYCLSRSKSVNGRGG